VCATAFPGTKPVDLPVIFGCSQLNLSSKTCTVHIGDGRNNLFVGYNRDIVLRHEIGHCNGWPKDHPSPRYYSEDASGKPLVQFPPYEEPGLLPREDASGKPLVQFPPYEEPPSLKSLWEGLRLIEEHFQNLKCLDDIPENRDAIRKGVPVCE
jgi:hypothetical protein